MCSFTANTNVSKFTLFLLILLFLAVSVLFFIFRGKQVWEAWLPKSQRVTVLLLTVTIIPTLPEISVIIHMHTSKHIYAHAHNHNKTKSNTDNHTTNALTSTERHSVEFQCIWSNYYQTGDAQFSALGPSLVTPFSHQCNVIVQFLYNVSLAHHFSVGRGWAQMIERWSVSSCHVVKLTWNRSKKSSSAAMDRLWRPSLGLVHFIVCIWSLQRQCPAIIEFRRISILCRAHQVSICVALRSWSTQTQSYG